MATRRFAPGYILSLATALAVGITLVVLALPRTAAGLAELQGTLAIDELREGAPISDQAIESAMLSFNGANGWVDSAARWSALARLHYARALLADRDSEERPAALRLSKEASRRAIALNPALPEPWLRLAQSEFALNRISPQMIRALAMTYRTGRYNRFTVYAMSELAFAAWSKLDGDTRKAASEQLAFAVVQHTSRLVAISERLHASAIVRRALRRQPELLAKFDRAIENHPRG
jgi:hypothetical protein